MIEKIGVIAPSSTVNLSKDIILRGVDFFKDRAIEVVFHDQCFKNNHGVAGSVEERVNAIEEYINDDSIDLIMCFWGGKNTNQILDNINYELLSSSNKPIVGYSDCTSLLAAVHKLSNIITFTGPGFITFTKPGDNSYSWNSLIDSLKAMRNKEKVSFKPSQYFSRDRFWESESSDRDIEVNDGIKSLNNQTCKGESLAININVLSSLIGTKYEPLFNNKVLFLEMSESWDKEVFVRLVVQLKQIGAFDKINGLVISKFMDGVGIEDEFLESLLREYVNKEIPILYNFDCGHTDPIFTVPNGVLCEIINSSLIFSYE